MSTQGDLLAAAKAAFAAGGYARTTLKGVAAAAGVAPQVLKSYYDNKEELFAAAMRLPYDPATAIPALLAPGLEGMGERLVRLAFATFSDEQVRSDMDAILKAGGGATRWTNAMSEYLELEVIDRVIEGRQRTENLALLRDLCDTLSNASLCAMGGLTPAPVLSALNHFPEDFQRPPAPAPGGRASRTIRRH